MRKRTKKMVSSMAVFLMAALLVACGSKTPGTTGQVSTVGTAAAAQSPKRIGLVMKTLTNPFFIEMEMGARKAEKECGIQLIVKTGAQETSIEQQISIVGDMIRDKVDAIVIAPGSSVELIPVLKKAQDAGIPIVNIDNRLDPAMSKKAGLVDVPFISVDNANGAYLSAKYVCDKVTAPTKAAILEGIRTAANGQERRKGALRAFDENQKIKVVASETANWKIDEAFEVTKKIFGDHPDVGVLFCANDMMALGAVHYLEQANNRRVLVAGFDALAEAKSAIKQGNLEVTIDQQPSTQGYLGVKYAIDMMHGRKPAPETMIDVRLVSKETL